MVNIAKAKPLSSARRMRQGNAEFNRRVNRRQAILGRRIQTVLLEQLKTKEDEPLKNIACIR